MITPLFRVDQDENFIYLNIHIKYVKFSDVDFYIENKNFKFYLKPYYLNLTFSDDLKSESELNYSKYDVDKGLLECKIEKEIPGTKFENLDLLSTLLNKNNNPNEEITKKLEEISIEDNPNLIKENLLLTIKDEESLNSFMYEFILNENSNKEENIILNSNYDKKFSFGFNLEYFDVFKNRGEELFELFDINPETTEIKNRFFAKMEKENEEFCPERYYYDINLDQDDDILKTALSLSLEKYFNKYINKDSQFQFNEKEINVLMSINKTSISLLEKSTNIYLNFYLQIVDIIFAFLYDLRLTEFEHNSESGWTINKISAVLSCNLEYKNMFYSFSNQPPFNYLEESLMNVLISGYRRILCYPLYRNLKLCEMIKNDLVILLEKENCVFFILKFMLRIRQILENSEPRHILNKIYIDGFIKWIQYYSTKEVWNMIGNVIKKMKIEKRDLKFDLEEIEEEFQNYEIDTNPIV